MGGFLILRRDFREAPGKRSHRSEGGVIRHHFRRERPDVAERHGAESFGDAPPARAHGAVHVQQRHAIHGPAAEFVRCPVEIFFVAVAYLLNADVCRLG